MRCSATIFIYINQCKNTAEPDEQNCAGSLPRPPTEEPPRVERTTIAGRSFRLSQPETIQKRRGAKASRKEVHLPACLPFNRGKLHNGGQPSSETGKRFGHAKMEAPFGLKTAFQGLLIPPSAHARQLRKHRAPANPINWRATLRRSRGKWAAASFFRPGVEAKSRLRRSVALNLSRNARAS